MRAFGLTGNMGSGKSTVAELLKEHPNVAVFDCDQIAKRIISDIEHREHITAILGANVFVDDKPDFRKLATIVFGDPEKKRLFEALIHPLVWASVEEKVSSMDPSYICIVESAIIFENHRENEFEAIIVVTCSEEEQLRRLREERKMTDDDIQARLRHQLSRHEKEDRAQFILTTECSLEELERAVSDLYHSLSRKRMDTSMTRKAVYAASLDPITNGHINVIERVAPLYDEVVVLVAVDSRKTYTFTPEERVDMARAAVAHLPNVRVDVCIGHYVVKHADSIDAQTIIRGLRNFKDLEDEQTLTAENRKICPHIETIWIPCLPDLMHVSSSMVKGHVGVDPSWEEQVARSVPNVVLKKLKKKFILAKARKHWAKLMEVLGNPEGSEAILSDLLARYTEPHRAYHNLTHIVAMLDEFEVVGTFDRFVALAIWYHDAIYDPKAKDNEEQSAKLARNAFRLLGITERGILLVSEFILTTKHQTPPVGYESQLLVDLDLMILGKPEKEFQKYEDGIREEYNWVDLKDFREGRTQVLQAFLDRPFIYSTLDFRNKYEVQAQVNLRCAIKALQK